MSDNKKKFYITTPIFYASGKPHLGHAYTSIACDVLARWKRKTGHEVFFLTGTDEHGQKVAEKAKENKISEQEYVDSLIPNFKKVLETLNITNDFFIRTTNEQHKAFVQKMLSLCYEKGDIYLGEYEGLYCVGCERYYTQTELLEGNICPDHKKPCVQMKEE
ncbi:MAG: class I tRNA ligase family protein, partial [Nanoarchaeota archaeon]|nr:class I tRNA ligase family protein [Nanoarchaeota archaeon]